MRRQARQVRQSIGVALQDAGLDLMQTGRELLRLSARLYNVPRADIEERISYLFDVVDLAGDADRRVGEYSGGMQRRLDLAAALVHSPGIIFLDEPTTGLDPVSRQHLWEYIVRLNSDDGVTFFLTTQYLEEADQLCDDIAILDAGVIVAQGSPKALKDTVSDDVISFEITGDSAGRQRAISSRLRPADGRQGQRRWVEQRDDLYQERHRRLSDRRACARQRGTPLRQPATRARHAR